jgi:hypothetical protein
VRRIWHGGAGAQRARELANGQRASLLVPCRRGQSALLFPEMLLLSHLDLKIHHC